MNKRRGGRRKTAVYTYAPSAGKVPHITQFKKEDEAIYFSFCKFDSTNKWGATGKSLEENFWEMAKRFHGYESMTWGQLRSKGDINFYPIAELPSNMLKALRRLSMADYDNIWSLPFSGKKRLWGLKSGNFFLMLWWDPDHNAYKVPK